GTVPGTMVPIAASEHGAVRFLCIREPSSDSRRALMRPISISKFGLSPRLVGHVRAPLPETRQAQRCRRDDVIECTAQTIKPTHCSEPSVSRWPLRDQRDAPASRPAGSFGGTARTRVLRCRKAIRAKADDSAVYKPTIRNDSKG